MKPGSSQSEERKFRILVILSAFGIVVMGLYGLLWTIRGDAVLAMTDYLGAFLLFLNLMLLRYFTQYDRHIYFGLGVFSILLVMIYWNGSLEEATYLWFFLYPPITANLLGSKKGGIASLVLLIPILASMVLWYTTDAMVGYSIFFGIRLIMAYSIVSFLIFRFEQAAEKNRAEIKELNASLEGTVQRRTRELIEKNALLAKEVTRRTASEKRLKTSVKEKEILLREVHHRTKNNMNVIISLLNLQKWHMKPENIESAFSLLKDRIYSMSTVHERLYRSENIATLDLGEYVLDLIQQLKASYVPQGAEVDLDHQADKVQITLDQAVPLGLALNEIITNAFKHGRVENQTLLLRTRIRKSDDEEITVEVSDNGPGLPKDFDPDSGETLGAHLIQILVVDQLAGTLEVESVRGTQYRIKMLLQG